MLIGNWEVIRSQRAVSNHRLLASGEVIQGWFDEDEMRYGQAARGCGERGYDRAKRVRHDNSGALGRLLDDRINLGLHVGLGRVIGDDGLGPVLPWPRLLA